MDPYLEVISYVERLHRQFLEVMKLELERSGIHDINNVQAMMLFNIGDAEMTVGELALRGRPKGRHRNRVPRPGDADRPGARPARHSVRCAQVQLDRQSVGGQQHHVRIGRIRRRNH